MNSFVDLVIFINILEWLWIIEFEHVLDCKEGQFWFHIDVKMKNTFCLYGV